MDGLADGRLTGGAAAAGAAAGARDGSSPPVHQIACMAHTYSADTVMPMLAFDLQ